MVRIFSMMVVAGLLGLAADKEESKIYSPTGKRDPFRPSIVRGSGRDVAAVSELERFAVEQFQLRAILRTDQNATALFEDPEGKTHILAEGSLIGRERATVSRILEREVVLTIQTVNYLGVEKPYEKNMVLPEK